jgi:hypothetical protein
MYCFTCIYNTSCLQRASVLQAGIIFYIFRNKRASLGSKCDKTDIHSNQEYEASAHFMHFRQLLTVSVALAVAPLCIIHYSVGFPSGKELALLEL